MLCSNGGQGHPPCVFCCGLDDCAEAVETIASTTAAELIILLRFVFIFFSHVWKRMVDKKQITRAVHFFLYILEKFG
jgi:hypothetical protein